MANADDTKWFNDNAGRFSSSPTSDGIRLVATAQGAACEAFLTPPDDTDPTLLAKAKSELVAELREKLNE